MAYSANSFMAVVKPVTLCMTLSAFITVSLYSDADGATNRWGHARVLELFVTRRPPHTKNVPVHGSPDSFPPTVSVVLSSRTFERAIHPDDLV